LIISKCSSESDFIILIGTRLCLVLISPIIINLIIYLLTLPSAVVFILSAFIGLSTMPSIFRRCLLLQGGTTVAIVLLGLLLPPVGNGFAPILHRALTATAKTATTRTTAAKTATAAAIITTTRRASSSPQSDQEAENAKEIRKIEEEIDQIKDEIVKIKDEIDKFKVEMETIEVIEGFTGNEARYIILKGRLKEAKDDLK